MRWRHHFAMISRGEGAAPTRVDELDGLRGVLAVWVVVAHILCWTGFLEVEFPRHGQFLWQQFLGAKSAVETFIILSGFAISFLLHGRQETYWRFMTGRFFRIYPVYLICLLAGWASRSLEPAILQNASWKNTFYFGDIHMHYAAEQAHPAAHLMAHLALLNGLLPPRVLPDAAFTYLPPAWSITLEWQYYLVAFLVARLVCSGRGLIILMALCLGGQVWQASSFLLTQLPLFLVGIGSYHLYALFSRWGRPRSPVLAIPAIVLLGFALISQWHFVAMAIWAIAFGSVFVAGTDGTSRMFAGVRRALLHPALQTLGKLSYCIYLVHWSIVVLVLWGLLRVRPQFSFAEAGAAMMLISLPLVLGVAMILHRWVEAPGMRWGKKLASRRAASSAVVAGVG